MPILQRIFKRNFIDPISSEFTCYKCKSHHQHVNQYIQCIFKIFSPYQVEKKSNICKQFINPAAIIADFITTTGNLTTTNLIYTDASYNHANGNSNGGILKLKSNYEFTYFGTNLNRLNMNRISLAEIATIVEGLNSLQDHNDAIIFTDSQTAVDSYAA